MSETTSFHDIQASSTNRSSIRNEEIMLSRQQASELTTRNSNLFNLGEIKVMIIGVGAIGSFAATSLVRSGCQNIILIDPDKVGSHNVGVQNYFVHQVGQEKVSALSSHLHAINPYCSVLTRTEKIEIEHSLFESNANSHVIIIAVDSMLARKKIAEAIEFYCGLSTDVPYVIDARMGAETFQMYVFDPWNLKDYLETWYSDEDADAGECAARSTAYCSSMAGSFICNEIVKRTKNTVRTKQMLFSFPSLLMKSTYQLPPE